MAYVIRSLLQVVGAGAVLLIALAGVAKFVDLDAFHSQLHDWTMLPRWLVNWLTVLVPSAEVALGVCWLGARNRRVWYYCAFAQLCMYTSAYLVQSSIDGVPACACLGAADAALRKVAGVPSVLLRNLALMLALIGGWASCNWRPRAGRLEAPGASA